MVYFTVLLNLLSESVLLLGGIYLIETRDTALSGIKEAFSEAQKSGKKLYLKK